MADTYKPLFPTNPAYGTARKAIDASFADKGLLNSSAWAGKQAEAADLDQQTQYNQQNALADRSARIFEMLASYGLRKKELLPKSKFKSAYEPGFFDQLQRMTYTPYTSGSPYGDPPENEEAPIGDPAEQWRRGPAENVGPTISQMQLSQQGAANAAAQSLANKRFEWEKSQAAPVAPRVGSTDWDTIIGAAASNYSNASDQSAQVDPVTGAVSWIDNKATAAMLPTQLLSAWRAQGVDIIGMAANPSDPNHERALGVLNEMYRDPASWQKLIAMRQPAATTAPAPAATSAGNIWRTLIDRTQPR